MIFDKYIHTGIIKCSLRLLPACKQTGDIQTVCETDRETGKRLRQRRKHLHLIVEFSQYLFISHRTVLFSLLLFLSFDLLFAHSLTPVSCICLVLSTIYHTVLKKKIFGVNEYESVIYLFVNWFLMDLQEVFVSCLQLLRLLLLLKLMMPFIDGRMAAVFSTKTNNHLLTPHHALYNMALAIRPIIKCLLNQFICIRCEHHD